MKKQYGGRPGFTHFASLPFIRTTHREAIQNLQTLVSSFLFKIIQEKKVKTASNMLMHLTLSMLILPNYQAQTAAINVYQKMREQFQQELKHTTLVFSKIGYFTKYNHQMKRKQVSVIYLQPEKSVGIEKIRKVTDKLIKQMMEINLVKSQDFQGMHIKYNKQSGMFENDEHHLTLFRLQGVPCDELFIKTMQEVKTLINPLHLECDFIDISTRFKYDETKFYTPLARVKLQSKN